MVACTKLLVLVVLAERSCLRYLPCLCWLCRGAQGCAAGLRAVPRQQGTSRRAPRERAACGPEKGKKALKTHADKEPWVFALGLL